MAEIKPDVKLAEIENLTGFNKIIDKEALTVVDFYTPWCGPCRTFAPRFQQLANDFKDVAFIKVDINKAEDVSDLYGITSIPTIMLFRNGKKIMEVENLRDLSTEIQVNLNF
ncbi:hypothetical protein H072_10002 [Dactylellina haptotyla CBS 200.50]|uniref:Thioredoxin domain-containing protein n=1 Tax=Dactylellina haptotyla (strain CBS 200.50) TaxID=1284197 RepID=S8A5N9_DACHA|nr:hypothetical protein H072_10002 [Dactylellina haptotyla CBS 200.50]